MESNIILYVNLLHMHYWKPLKNKLTNPVTIKFSILLNKNISTNQKPGLLQTTIGVIVGITLRFFNFFFFPLFSS